jgi:hypothetical protein
MKLFQYCGLCARQDPDQRYGGLIVDNAGS